MTRQTSFLALGLAALGLAGLQVFLKDRSEPRPREPLPIIRTAHAATESNILPGDYVGPESCKDCHAKEYKSWSQHNHHRMNQLANEETVRGDFSGQRVVFEEGDVVFSREGSTYTMTLEREGKLVRRYRITRTVGWRFMQFYVGIQTDGPEPKGSVCYRDEQKLPFGYWFKLKRWLPTSYFDPLGPETKKDGTLAYDPYENPRVHLYAGNCMLCHNTYPYEYRLALPNGLAGFPEGDVLLAEPQLRSELARTIDLSPREGSPATIRDRIRPENLVTLGISCESCHFGLRAHAGEQEAAVRFLPTSPYLKIEPADGSRAVSDKKNPYAVNHVCAQCHCATVTLHPNGAGTWNSREALDMLGGACATKIKCTDCHDPHVRGLSEAGPDKPEHVAACTTCHAKLAEPEARKAHSRHSANVNCLDCHMPRITQGLEEVVRTHRISSPTDTKMLAAGAPNSCNLCHLDRSLSWTLSELERGFGKKIQPGPEWAKAYGGSLDAPVGKAWLEGADQATRLVAAQAYSRSPLGKAALPDLIRALGDPIAVNRVFASFAIERVRGKPLSVEEYDATAPAAKREQAIEILLKTP